MRAGVICEGPTDFAVLKPIIEKFTGAQVFAIQPDLDGWALGKPSATGPGWQGVRAYLGCERFPVAVANHDLVVIHVDADVREKVGLGGDDLDALCDHVKKWIDGPAPANSVIVLPREATDAWLVAAHTNRHNVEEIPRPAEELAAQDLITDSDKGKRSKRYAELMPGLLKLVNTPKDLSKVAELRRFVDKLRAFVKLRRRKLRG